MNTAKGNLKILEVYARRLSLVYRGSTPVLDGSSTTTMGMTVLPSLLLFSHLLTSIPREIGRSPIGPFLDL